MPVDPDAFAAFLAAHPAAAGGDLSEEGRAELELAFACREGDAAALARFEARYLAQVPAALGHMKLQPALVDEVRQRVREKLLVGGRLAEYAGRGRLSGLVGVIAVRTAVSLLRQGKREIADTPAILDVAAAGADPALEMLKDRYRADFQAAFEEAVRGLESRERNLLRLQLLGGVTLEKIGEMYGVHRATVVRWMAKIRGDLLGATKAGL